MEDLAALQKKITGCQKCPRLVRYLAGIRRQFPTYWCKPVPSFGDPKARILLIGLAPGRFGSNRTARMFTGDASGNFLYPVLYETGLASQPKAWALEDGLKLRHAYITAVLRCAPPQNKPARDEIRNCLPYLEEELSLLSHLRVVVALGKIAHDEYVKIRIKEGGGKMKDFPFRHGAVHHFQESPKILIDTYHPSRQNTNTGKLTREMFLEIFHRAVKLTEEYDDPVYKSCHSEPSKAR